MRTGNVFDSFRYGQMVR